MKRSNRRPCWVVLAPGTRADLWAEILRVYGCEPLPWDEEGFSWEILDGKRGYVAIVEPAPGSEAVRDTDLGEALSRISTEMVYVLWLHDEAPRVRAFVSGAYAGEVAAWPDDVAAALGCSFPGMSAGKHGAIDLTAHPPVKAGPGERKIAGLTAAQWARQMKHGDWSVLLDGAGPKSAREVIDALHDEDGAVRLLACKLVGALDEHRLGVLARRALEALVARAKVDGDPEVRAAAAEARDDLRESIEREEVRRKLPWIVNYRADMLPIAIETLDDPRETVRRELYLWWMGARDLPPALRLRIVEKLEALVARETEPLTRRLAESALARIRR